MSVAVASSCGLLGQAFLLSSDLVDMWRNECGIGLLVLM